MTNKPTTYHIVDHGPDFSGNERYSVAEVLLYPGGPVIVRTIPWWDVTWDMLRLHVDTKSDADIINDFDTGST